MMSRRFVMLAVVIGAAGLLVTGCRGTKAKTGGGGDGKLGPVVIDEGGGAMGDKRFADGDRIQGLDMSAVLFAYDQFQVQGSEAAKIEKVADYMRKNQRTRLVAEGHCDERGSNEYNLALGENRALAVRGYLVKLGIDPSRIQTRSYGEEQPADPGHTEAAWRLNRRVEFALYK